MRSLSLHRVLLSFSLLAFANVCHPAAPTAAERNARLGAEIERLQSALKTADAAGLPKDVQPMVGDYEKALQDAARVEDPDYRLYRLRDPFVGVEKIAFLAKQKAAGESLDAFRQLWLESRTRFEAKEPQHSGSLLERGLIESAASRAERLFRASLPYAKASGPFSGVYYLAEAEGNLRFRNFVDSVASHASEATPDRDRLASTVETLEREAVKFFGGDISNQKMVPVSVRLKEARELLDAGRLNGSALLLVESRLAFSRRGGPGGTYPAEAKIGKGSVPAMLEAWAAGEEPATAEIVKKEAEPFFATLLLPGKAATKRPSMVTVTLVRWPYT